MRDPLKCEDDAIPCRVFLLVNSHRAVDHRHDSIAELIVIAYGMNQTRTPSQSNKSLTFSLMIALRMV